MKNCGAPEFRSFSALEAGNNLASSISRFSSKASGAVSVPGADG